MLTRMPTRPRSALRVGAIALVMMIAVAACSGDDGGGQAQEPSAAEDAGLTRADVDASIAGLDDIVETAMDQTGVPGVALAVVFDDEIVYTQGYGVRSVGSDEPIEPETIFEIASLSKPVSSTIVAGVVGDGIVAWDDPVVDYNPEFELSDPLVTEAVSFADLFAHRSGMPGGGGDVLETIGYDREEILDRLRFLPLNPFRSTYAYSNFALTAGGESAAVAAETTWEELADSVLFEPAGMDSTSMRHADYEAAENRAELHVQTDDGWAPDFERMPDAQAPAGGVSSNVEDLGRWLRLQLAGGRIDGEQVIDEEALDLTHTPMVVKSPPTPTVADPASFYGLGWNIETDATGATRWNHSGAFSLGAATTVKALPAEGLGIVVLTNGAPIGVPEGITDAYFDLVQSGEWSTDVFDLWRERFGGLYGEPLDLGDPPSPGTAALDDAAYMGTYTNDYVGDVDVIVTDEGLALVEGPAEIVYPLTHFDGNTFTYLHDLETPDFLSEVTFDVSDETAEAITIGAFDAEGQGTLRRI